jgi:DNA-binding NtrC family response regulator
MTPTPAPPTGPILLIDDDEFIAGSLRDYLVSRGLSVDVALEPAAAEALMCAQRYATVVVDPYLTGGVYGENASLLDTIHRLQPSTAVLILTGYGSAAMIHAASSDESTTLLFKPQPIIYLSQLIVEASTSSPSVKGSVPTVLRSVLRGHS